MKINTKYLILTCASSMLFSCGPQEVEVNEQQQGYIKAPPYSPIEQGVFLTADNSISSVSYEGPILIWKNDIKPQQVKEVLRFKDETMELDLAYKREAFKVDYLKQEKAKLEEGVKIAKDKIAENDLNQFYQDRDKQVGLAKSWLESLNLDAQQTKDLQTYCQAMVWKFATSETLKNHLFSLRPSPLSICEPYYKEEGFFTSAECQASQDGSYKDYYACFWSDSGVLKTDISYYDSLGDLLADEDAAQLKKAMQAQVLKNKNLIKLAAIKDGNLFIEFNGESELLLSFDRSDFFDFKDLIGDVLKGQFGFKSSTEEGKILQDLLLERDIDSDAAQALHYNFNDRVLNFPFSSPIESKNAFRISPEDINSLNAFAETVPQLFGPKLSEEVIKLLKNQNDLILSLKSQIEPIEQLLKMYQTPIGAEEPLEEAANFSNPIQNFGVGLDLFKKKEAWENKRVDSAKFVIGEGMVKALWAYSKVDFIKKGKLLSIVFYIDSKARETVPLQACFDTEQNAQVDCGELSLSVTHAKMKVFMEDPSTGIINLEINSDPANEPVNENVFLDTAIRPEDEPLYQEEDLDRNTLKTKKTIKLEVMAGLYQHELPVLTGKAFIYNLGSQDKQYEGTVSLTKAATGI
ncbi:MAG: hypothetical protein HRU09_08930 [Oligoflexales bacterium]|nr:hypothetical protein [Oligoflexales bacterium]